MRIITLAMTVVLVMNISAADLESRVLTHYVPQDFLETAVRTEGWTELKLNVKGGLRKGDVVRIWSGGNIDYGNGDQPGQNLSGPSGRAQPVQPLEMQRFALATDPALAYAVLVK